MSEVVKKKEDKGIWFGDPESKTEAFKIYTDGVLNIVCEEYGLKTKNVSVKDDNGNALKDEDNKTIMEEVVEYGFIKKTYHATLIQVLNHIRNKAIYNLDFSDFGVIEEKLLDLDKKFSRFNDIFFSTKELEIDIK